VVVVGVVVSGAFSPCPQAVSAPMAMIAPMPCGSGETTSQTA
jgi:hypothetical protein